MDVELVTLEKGVCSSTYSHMAGDNKSRDGLTVDYSSVSAVKFFNRTDHNGNSILP